MEYEYPEALWAVSIDTVAIERVICSPLDHGKDCPRYIRADIAERLADALLAQICEYGPVSEGALDLLNMFFREDEQ